MKKIFLIYLFLICILAPSYIYQQDIGYPLMKITPVNAQEPDKKISKCIKYMKSQGVEEANEIGDAIYRYRGDLDHTLIMAIIEVESEYNARAINRRNCIGLMQIRAYDSAGNSVWDSYLKKKGYIKQTGDLIGIDTNIRAGCHILQDCLKRHKGIATALWAYNGKDKDTLEYLDLILAKQQKILKAIS